jgi:hypothetical protein
VLGPPGTAPWHGRTRTHSLAGVACTPHQCPRGQTCVCRTITGLCMLAHFGVFCNQYPPDVCHPRRAPQVTQPAWRLRPWSCDTTSPRPCRVRRSAAGRPPQRSACARDFPTPHTIRHPRVAWLPRPWAGPLLIPAEAIAHVRLDAGHRTARVPPVPPPTCNDILPSLPRARAASATPTAPATIQQAEAAERRWQECSLAWRQQALARRREALSAAALDALEASIRTPCHGTPAFAPGFAGRVAVDAVLDTRADLPACPAWRVAHVPASPATRAVPVYTGGTPHAS